MDNSDDLRKELQTVKQKDALCFIEIKCAIGSRPDLGRPTTTSAENKKNDYIISDASYRITSNSVKKAGPGMAFVKLKYSVTLNGYSSMDIIFPFGIMGGITFDSSPDAKTEQFTYSFEGEYTLYMYKEKGTWKFSQNAGYDWIKNMTSVKEVSE